MKEEIIQLINSSDNAAKLEFIRIILQKPYDMELFEIIHKILQQC